MTVRSINIYSNVLCIIYQDDEGPDIASGLFFKKGVLEFVVKILDKYTSKEFLKILF